MLAQEASEKEKEREGPFPLGGDSGHRDKDPAGRWDNTIGDLGFGSLQLAKGGGI